MERRRGRFLLDGGFPRGDRDRQGLHGLRGAGRRSRGEAARGRGWRGGELRHADYDHGRGGGRCGRVRQFSPEETGGGEEAAAESPPAPSVAASAPPPPPAADDLPHHIVVGMPALPPTTDAGTISKWNVAEGESFSAGDSIAVIETDKASIFFEAQEDGILAKILAGAGAGEMAVGVPIMVTVEEDVAAFANYVAGAEEDAPAAASAVEEVVAEPVAAAAAPVPAAAPTPVAVPVAAAVAAAPTAPTGAISMSQPGVSSEKWECHEHES